MRVEKDGERGTWSATGKNQELDEQPQAESSSA